MAETVYYTLEEIAKHDGKNGTDVWIIVKNIVYNMTPYMKLDEHPGGNELIEEWAGRECTRAFDDAGHSGDAKKSMKEYKIGEVALEDRGKKPVKSKPVEPVTTQKDINKAPPAMIPDTKERNGRSCIGIITCGLMA